MKCPECGSKNCYETKEHKIVCRECNSITQKDNKGFLSRMFKKFKKGE